MPDTLDYMIMGYVAGFGLLFLLVGSLWWRYKNLQADETALQQLEAETPQPETIPNRR